MSRVRHNKPSIPFSRDETHSILCYLILDACVINYVKQVILLFQGEPNRLKHPTKKYFFQNFCQIIGLKQDRNKAVKNKLRQIARKCVATKNGLMEFLNELWSKNTQNSYISENKTIPSFLTSKYEQHISCLSHLILDKKSKSKKTGSIDLGYSQTSNLSQHISRAEFIEASQHSLNDRSINLPNTYNLGGVMNLSSYRDNYESADVNLSSSNNYSLNQNLIRLSKNYLRLIKEVQSNGTIVDDAKHILVEIIWITQEVSNPADLVLQRDLFDTLKKTWEKMKVNENYQIRTFDIECSHSNINLIESNSHDSIFPDDPNFQVESREDTTSCLNGFQSFDS